MVDGFARKNPSSLDIESCIEGSPRVVSSNGRRYRMSICIRYSRLFTFLLIVLALGSLMTPIVTGLEQPSLPFAQAELFVELNDTDGDLGLHAAIDGGTWTRLEIEDPRERELLGIISVGRLQ